MLILAAFCAIYWLFMALYLEIRWGVITNESNEFIKKTLLSMKKDFTLEILLSILQHLFMIMSFGLFVFCYQRLFPEIERGPYLCNPLQVIAQLCCFLLNFHYPFTPVRVRHVLLFCFSLSLISSLHLQGIDWPLLSFVLCVCLLLIYWLPDYALLSMFCGYFLDQRLAKWGFHMAWQQVCHYALSCLLDPEMYRSTPKRRCLAWIALLMSQLIYGFLYYKDLYLMEPLKLAALLSGACIIFISLARRTTWPFIIAFGCYFFISLVIGIKSAPSETTKILGLPYGICIFVFIHVWVCLGLFLFKERLPLPLPQALVPLFFSGVLSVLCAFPELAWLERWLEGLDLLLLIIGLFSFCPAPQIKATGVA